LERRAVPPGALPGFPHKFSRTSASQNRESRLGSASKAVPGNNFPVGHAISRRRLDQSASLWGAWEHAIYFAPRRESHYPRGKSGSVYPGNSLIDKSDSTVTQAEALLGFCISRYCFSLIRPPISENSPAMMWSTVWLVLPSGGKTRPADLTVARYFVHSNRASAFARADYCYSENSIHNQQPTHYDVSVRSRLVLSFIVLVAGIARGGVVRLELEPVPAEQKDASLPASYEMLRGKVYGEN
jgi:hypothetical protein